MVRIIAATHDVTHKFQMSETESHLDDVSQIGEDFASYVKQKAFSASLSAAEGMSLVEKKPEKEYPSFRRTIFEDTTYIPALANTHICYEYDAQFKEMKSHWKKSGKKFSDEPTQWWKPRISATHGARKSEEYPKFCEKEQKVFGVERKIAPFSVSKKYTAPLDRCTIPYKPTPDESVSHLGPGCYGIRDPWKEKSGDGNVTGTVAFVSKSPGRGALDAADYDINKEEPTMLPHRAAASLYHQQLTGSPTRAKTPSDYSRSVIDVALVNSYSDSRPVSSQQANLSMSFAAGPLGEALSRSPVHTQGLDNSVSRTGSRSSIRKPKSTSGTRSTPTGQRAQSQQGNRPRSNGNNNNNNTSSTNTLSNSNENSNSNSNANAPHPHFNGSKDVGPWGGRINNNPNSPPNGTPNNTTTSCTRGILSLSQSRAGSATTGMVTSTPADLTEMGLERPPSPGTGVVVQDMTILTTASKDSLWFHQLSTTKQFGPMVQNSPIRVPRMPRKGEKPKHGANLGGHPGVKFGQGKLGLSALDELTGTRQADKHFRRLKLPHGETVIYEMNGGSNAHNMPHGAHFTGDWAQTGAYAEKDDALCVVSRGADLGSPTKDDKKKPPSLAGPSGLIGVNASRPRQHNPGPIFVQKTRPGNSAISAALPGPSSAPKVLPNYREWRPPSTIGRGFLSLSQKSTPLRVSLEGLPTRQPVPKHLQQYVEPAEETYDMQKFAERCAKPSSSTAGGRLSRSASDSLGATTTTSTTFRQMQRQRGEDKGQGQGEGQFQAQIGEEIMSLADQSMFSQE